MPKAIPATSRQAAVKLYASGFNLREAARMTGTSHEAVRRWVLSSGLQTRPVGRPARTRAAPPTTGAKP